MTAIRSCSENIGVDLALDKLQLVQPESVAGPACSAMPSGDEAEGFERESPAERYSRGADEELIEV